MGDFQPQILYFWKTVFQQEEHFPKGKRIRVEGSSLPHAIHYHDATGCNCISLYRAVLAYNIVVVPICVQAVLVVTFALSRCNLLPKLTVHFSHSEL